MGDVKSAENEIPREWCEEAAKREAEHGDPDCTVHPPLASKERLTNARITTLIDYAQQTSKPWLCVEVVEALMEVLDWRNRAEIARLQGETSCDAEDAARWRKYRELYDGSHVSAGAGIRHVLATEISQYQTPIAAAEIVLDEANTVLWVERFVFSRIHAVGDNFIRDYKEYRVLRAGATHGKHGGILVEHVVKLVSDRSPQNAPAIETSREPKVGDKARLHFCHPDIPAEGWTVAEVRRDTTYFLKHPNGGHFSVPPDQFTAEPSENGEPPQPHEPVTDLKDAINKALAERGAGTRTREP